MQDGLPGRALSEEELKRIYNWVDAIPLSRTKTNINRDFSDAVLAAEIIYHYLPNLVEKHNYSGVNSLQKKIYNWNTLNTKVLKHIGIRLRNKELEDLAGAKPESIERFLVILLERLEGNDADRFKAKQSTTRSANFNQTQKSATAQQDQTVNSKQKFTVIGKGEEEKNVIITELKETIEILEAKIAKMEMLVRIRNDKIDKLQNKLAAHGHPVN